MTLSARSRKRLCHHQVDLYTNIGGPYRASVPNGAGDEPSRSLLNGLNDQPLGRTALAVKNINNIIAPALIQNRFKVNEQKEIDDFLFQLNGIKNTSKQGSNDTLAVSLAVCKAAAAEKSVPLYQHIADLAENTKIVLPIPAFNVINGGCVSGNKLATRELLIVATGARTFSEAMKMGTRVYHALGSIIHDKYGLDATAIYDHGGYAPNVKDEIEALDLITDAIEQAGYVGQVEIGMDICASDLQTKKKFASYFGNSNLDEDLTTLSDYYNTLITNYPIVFIEDLFDRCKWQQWMNFIPAADIQIVGDELTMSDAELIQEAANRKACNLVVLKIGRCTSVTECIKLHTLAKSKGLGVIISHRLGETEETFLADFAIGVGCEQVKFGAPCQSERLAKYNQILRIEEELESSSMHLYAATVLRKKRKSVDDGFVLSVQGVSKK